MNNIFSDDQISMIFQNIPKYMYIKISLTNKLKSGELVEGDKLPTETELCDSYGCSRLTVRKALDEPYPAETKSAGHIKLFFTDPVAEYDSHQNDSA